MSIILQQIEKFKQAIEDAIREKGAKGKESVIRSSIINLLHDAVKYELINCGIKEDNIFPHIYQTKPEIKIAGQLKQKVQDICVVPTNIEKQPTRIDWGPMQFENLTDPLGYKYSINSLVINIRSQISSIAKNTDTIFERTLAEALNLKMRLNDIVLGEVFMIPTHEYDDNQAKLKKIAFKSKATNIEKYISFFTAINNRRNGGELYAYERCALLIVDFKTNPTTIYKTSDELKRDGLLPNECQLDLSKLAFDTLAPDLIKCYSERHDIKNLSNVILS